MPELLDLMNARSRALHVGYHLYAQRLTREIVDALSSVPQHCPRFQTEFFFDASPFVFDRINEHGDVVYKRATEENFIEMQKAVPSSFRYTHSGLRQKGMTPLDRLRHEHVAELNSAEGARFGHPDELLGAALTGYPVERG